MNSAVTLVGDGVENPANALVMIHAAEMFGASCCFRDTKGLSQAPEFVAGVPLIPIQSNALRERHSRIVAFDNLPGAGEVYGFRAGKEFALTVGNERRGLSHEFSELATDRVHVPMLSRKVNCLNVAAASTVGLYYLCGTPVGAMAVRNQPASRRPEVLLLGAGDQFELGSAIRSVAAFGWGRAFIEDRDRVWFDCDRATRSEGRAAARRGKNDVLCIPFPPSAGDVFTQVTVITRKAIGTPLHRLNLSRGAGQVIVIPDESRVDVEAEKFSRLGHRVEFGHLQIPAANYVYHYRLAATIALAEIARQVGRPPGLKAPPAKRPPIYDRKLALMAEANGEWIGFEELLWY